MLDIIKFILRFLNKIYLYESISNKKKVKFKNLEIRIFKNIKKINSLELKNFIKIKNLSKRFKYNQFLIVLYKKEKQIGYGWFYEGNYWRISEINRTYPLKKAILLFDFNIKKKFRNKGYYKKFLILIKNIKKNKKFFIYALKTNKLSRKGILNAGFKVKDILKFRI